MDGTPAIGPLSTPPELFVGDSEFSNVVELTRYRARHQPAERAYVYLKDGELETEILTYAGLDHCARAIAARLQQQFAPGARVVLAYAPGLDFIAAFFGCLYAGVVAVPIYPPNRENDLDRFAKVVSDAACAGVCTHAARVESVHAAMAAAPALQGLTCLTTDGIDPVQADLWRNPVLGPDTLAFLQYTSGSTGTPKGVMVSHANLLHNQELIKRAFHHSQRSVVVSWLPLYHDMGLIGHVLHPLYMGITSVLMAPGTFIYKPVCWLQAITRYRATTSGGPNFAYDLCVRRVTQEQMAGLDLSSWEIAFNGSETVRRDTLERFAEKFAACGFRRAATFSCYGMAESTLFITSSSKSTFPATRSLDNTALQRHRVARMTDASTASVDVVSCGRALGQHVVIVDPNTRHCCPPDRVGEIWVKGASVAQGYWNNAEATAVTFGATLADTGEGPFLRTGDLGFIEDGELFVTGRLKDLIIIRGRNYYPHDIEATVRASHPALGHSSGAAFSVDTGGEERLVVAHEIGRVELRRLSSAEVISAARLALMAQLGLTLHDLVLLKQGGLPKTSSGKIRRRASREAYMTGNFEHAKA